VKSMTTLSVTHSTYMKTLLLTTELDINHSNVATNVTNN